MNPKQKELCQAGWVKLTQLRSPATFVRLLERHRCEVWERGWRSQSWQEEVDINAKGVFLQKILGETGPAEL